MIGHSSVGRQLRYLWSLVGIILLAALLRLPSLDAQSIAFDEGYSIAVGSATWPVLFQATLSSGVHPPLFYILNKFTLSMWGITEFGARFLVAVAGLLTIPLIYRLGQVMFNRQTGLLAATLLALNPVHTWLSQEARMYGILILAVTSSMLFFWQALQTNQRRYWMGLLMANALAFNLHYFALWVPVVQFIVILSNFGRYIRQFRVWVVIQFLAGLTLLPWLAAIALREYQSFGIGFLQQPHLLDLPLTLWNFAIGFSGASLWPVTGLALISFALALLNGLRQGERKIRSPQIMLALWLFLPLVFVWFISLRRPFYADRYLSFVIPGFVLLVSFGAARLARLSWRRLLIAALIMASLYGLVAMRLDPAFQKDNWRGAAAYIERNERPADIVLLYTAHIKIPFDYYYQGHASTEPLSLNLERFPIEQLVAGHRRAWVVYPYTRRPTHYPMQPLLPNGYWEEDPDRNPELVRWLETHTDDITDYQHFPGIQLWLVDNLQAEE